MVRVAIIGLGAEGMPADMLTTGFSPQALRASARGELATALGHYRPAGAVLPLLRRAPPAEVGLVNAMRYLDLKLTLGGDLLVDGWLREWASGGGGR